MGGVMMEAIQDLRFQALPADARAVWAKSGEGGCGHGLLAHLLDVAAVAEVLLQREPPATRIRAAKALSVDETAAQRWVAALAGLHDFGKAIAGFQAKWPEGQRQVALNGLDFTPATLACDNHSLATAAVLPLRLAHLSSAPSQWCAHVVQAISAHHGYHFQPAQVAAGRPRREGPRWVAAREAILQAYWRTLTPQGAPSAQALPLSVVNWLAGLTSVADWIASNPDWFPMGERRDSLADYYRHAMDLAGQALRQIGWPDYAPLLREEVDLDEQLGRIVQRQGMTARPLQRGGNQLLRDARGPALLLVEAPMGEGKTELAFLAHLRLQAANQHRGLYVALPTQATGNAMFKRAATFLEAFASGPMDVQLVHGGAAMNEDLRALRDINQSAQETLAASAWFGQRRRPLLSPYGVGTVDQALYAVLNVRHHFVRLWGLSNRVVVLDEVHAYDTYTSGLIDMLLRWLKALGCSVVLMSATLPRSRRNELLFAWGAGGQATPTPDYPRLLLADDAGVRSLPVAARPLAPIALSGLGSDIEALADAAMASVAGGGCGALIVNTVQRAQSLYLALQSRIAATELQDVTLLLFHARFPADERATLERRVLSLFGPEGERPPRALLVATQVAEQSLDVDFDFMFSDLAPVDLLLQRAGRLHRHDLRRPQAHAVARLQVAGLLPGQLPELKQTAWGFVYDPYVLGRTWALLLQQTSLRLPDDIDRLVQAVYDDDLDLPEGLDPAARDFIEIEAYGAFRAKLNKERSEAFGIVVHPDAEPQEAYTNKPRGREEDELGLGLENRTRLGPETVTLVPVLVGEDGRWHVQAGDAGFAPDQPVDAATARALYNRQLKLGRAAVVKHFQTTPIPLAFAAHPLLQHVHPMPLHDGVCTAGNVLLRLSAALGLVVEKAEEAMGTSSQSSPRSRGP
jgi:CRISPR-associated endonuclease/helicase Cas3